MRKLTFRLDKEYDARVGMLSDDSGAQLLAVIDDMLRMPPTRSAAAVDRELRGLHAARRRWRR